MTLIKVFKSSENQFISYDFIQEKLNKKKPLSKCEIRERITSLRNNGYLVISKKKHGYCLVNLKTCSNELAKEAMKFIEQNLITAKKKIARFSKLKNQLENNNG